MKKPVLIIMIVVFTLIISTTAMAGGRYYRGHGGPYYGGGHGGHGNHYPEVLLGGLIVGGIIGSQINNPYSRRPVYVNAYPVPAPVASGTSFLLKPNGDCFLISNSSSGNQILSSVPASNCQ